MMEFIKAKAPMQKYEPKITNSSGSVLTNGETIALIQLSRVATLGKRHKYQLEAFGR